MQDRTASGVAKAIDRQDGDQNLASADAHRETVQPSAERHPSQSPKDKKKHRDKHKHKHKKEKGEDLRCFASEKPVVYTCLSRLQGRSLSLLACRSQEIEEEQEGAGQGQEPMTKRAFK